MKNGKHIMQHATALSRASHPAQDQTPNDLLTHFNSYFRTQAADTESLIQTAQAIRYQVYCLERKFENPEEQRGCLESDVYDSAAAHSLVIHRATETAIGTGRLILPYQTQDGMPIQRLLAENGFNAADYFPIETSAEVSRFAISNQFRRRPGDNGVVPGATGEQDRECRGAMPCLGLIQEITRQSRALGLTHWAAVMEPKLLRMLALIGIHFTPVGPLVSHHGLRQPSYACIAQVLERLKRERPDHWAVVTDGGVLMPQEQALGRRRAA
jgi:N-acyl amino acid synthase of PEP-CTERM/exosortase system